MPRISKVYQLSDIEFRKLIAEHTSYADCARALGMSVAGANSYNQLHKRIEELGIDISHFSATANANRVCRQDLKDILVEDSTYHNISSLKKRLLAENMLEYKCQICGNTGEWNGRPLALQLHHVNGQHYDHRIENLVFLCPNCHSQTETYSGRNK